MRVSQIDKMNYLKKNQECEELKKEIKYSDQRANEFENKLEDKEQIISTLQSKIVKFESDMARMDYEYQKLRNKYG
jgi:chromosome segregation ATPase